MRSGLVVSLHLDVFQSCTSEQHGRMGCCSVHFLLTSKVTHEQSLTSGSVWVHSSSTLQERSSFCPKRDHAARISDFETPTGLFESPRLGRARRTKSPSSSQKRTPETRRTLCVKVFGVSSYWTKTREGEAETSERLARSSQSAWPWSQELPKGVRVRH